MAAHNSVLRRWLRRECEDPQIEIDAALDAVRTMFNPHPRGDEPVVIVVPEPLSMSELGSRISEWATSTEQSAPADDQRHAEANSIVEPHLS